MKRKHELLYDAALKAIEAVFSDTSVNRETTKESLTGLKDEIENYLNTL